MRPRSTGEEPEADGDLQYICQGGVHVLLLPRSTQLSTMLSSWSIFLCDAFFICMLLPYPAEEMRINQPNTQIIEMCPLYFCACAVILALRMKNPLPSGCQIYDVVGDEYALQEDSVLRRSIDSEYVCRRRPRPLALQPTAPGKTDLNAHEYAQLPRRDPSSCCLHCYSHLHLC